MALINSIGGIGALYAPLPRAGAPQNGNENAGQALPPRAGTAGDDPGGPMSAPDAAQYVGRFYYNLFLNQEKAPAHGILVPFGKEIDLADTLPDYDLHLEDGRSLHIQVQRTRREGPSPYTFVVKG